MTDTTWLVIVVGILVCVIIMCAAYNIGWNDGVEHSRWQAQRNVTADRCRPRCASQETVRRIPTHRGSTWVPRIIDGEEQ